MKKINDSNVTRVEERNGVKLIKFTPFDNLDFVEVAFSTRIGGVSEGDYFSMNLSFTRGDKNENVAKNFELMAGALGVSVSDMVMTYQTHTTNVIVAKEEYKGMGIIKEYDFTDIDGMITDKKNLVIVTSYADCVPVFIVDKERKVVASSHSGWRGTVSNITDNTINLMKKTYGCEEKDLIAVVGPSICKDCYEVSEDVASQFYNAYTKEEAQTILEEKGNGKYLLDLHEANRYNLINAGVLPENVYVTDVCTCCNSDMLFSHRKTGGKRGGLCGFIWLKQ